MLNWLDRFWHNVTGTVGQQVSNAVHWALHALASVVFAVFRLVGGAWSGLVTATQDFHKMIDRWAAAVMDFAGYILHHVIPTIVNWAKRELARLDQFINHLWRWAERGFVFLEHALTAGLKAVQKWALENIWRPLKAYADQIWADLKKWGYTAWWYITHPAALAELLIFPLATSLEKHAWELASQLGQFALSLVLANLKRFIHLIEDIITAVL